MCGVFTTCERYATICHGSKHEPHEPDRVAALHNVMRPKLSDGVSVTTSGRGPESSIRYITRTCFPSASPDKSHVAPCRRYVHSSAAQHRLLLSCLVVHCIYNARSLSALTDSMDIAP